ncbi:hypothetical protein GCM10010371_26180 [Streptomyces subrutilus]|uniref:Uncharacterized protein n=1 Tax=Streptomyces subrutilus TaxID=36818 RepID=A0A918V320_9ACTN|nr:hypothetical protein GCM10010371_26180 [Streptomyces subrutilus]
MRSHPGAAARRGRGAVEGETAGGTADAATARAVKIAGDTARADYAERVRGPLLQQMRNKGGRVDSPLRPRQAGARGHPNAPGHARRRRVRSPGCPSRRAERDRAV